MSSRGYIYRTNENASQNSFVVFESCFWQEGHTLVAWSAFDGDSEDGPLLDDDEKVVYETGIKCFILRSLSA